MIWPPGADMVSPAYELTELVQGYPGRSVHHGYLGWSTVSLLRSGQRVILVDTGSFGMRAVLAHRLEKVGVRPSQVTDILLTHAHYDHAANYLLFPSATVWISDRELAWANGKSPEFDPLPELYAQDLVRNRRVHSIDTSERSPSEVLPGIYAILADGHTPGSMIYHAVSEQSPMLFTGDAVKNRAELSSHSADRTLDADASTRTIELVHDLWESLPNALLVPGHDLPMRWDAQTRTSRHVGERKAAVQAWLDTSPDSVTTFDLAGLPVNDDATHPPGG